MMIRWIAAGTLVLACVVGGCTHEYNDQRPPVTDLDKRDTGLQSKDVVQASDEMAAKLLADPNLNASHTRWTIVVDRVENRTVSAREDLDIFLERLKSNLARLGHGRVQLIENRDKLRELQSRELEGVPGTPSGAPGPAGIQPDYSLYARISELPNRGTSYYFMEFSLTDLRTREIAWTDAFEVKVAR
jgi:PBP1b-binding outer membrane lipoprotein LpoB